jgi:hypothetical protein
VIERHFTATRLNEVVNDPSVLPYVCGMLAGPLDFSETVADTRHVLLMGEHGGILFVFHQQGLFEAHTQVLKAGRGEWALKMARSALDWMYAHTNAIEIITRVAKGNYAALALAKACGLKPVTVVTNGWETVEGKKDATVLSLSIQDWMNRSDSLAERGAWVKKRWRDSPIEDARVLGAMFEMMSHGQLAKAAIFLSRWVAIIGADFKVEPLTFDPPRLQIGRSIVVVRDETRLSVVNLEEATGTEEYLTP